MAAHLKAADLTRADLLELLENMQVPESDIAVLRIWLEAPAGWALDYWRGLSRRVNWCASGRRPSSVEGTDAIAAAWAGRIFAPTGELRWRVVESLGDCCCRTVFLGNVDWTAGRLSERSHLLQPLSSRTDRYFLWGQQTTVSTDDWVELRIPHRFRYPLGACSKGVRAVVELWSDEGGDLHFARLCDLEPYQEAE